MDEYIWRGAAIEQFEDSTSAIPEKLARIRIESVPAADVVEVVRCRDCVHGEHYYGGVSCRMPSFPEWKVHEKDYFCADGERKDGGQDDG